MIVLWNNFSLTIHWIDLSIFLIYLVLMLGIGFYFLRKNKSEEDYYVGGRSMSAGHIGLSVVATDVGGGFSIGLGGLGFLMGLSGSWMLFTGLLGAWLSSVFLIPKVYHRSRIKNHLTFPQMLLDRYDTRVALVAGIISLIGYTGFTSSQILAGAKLAAATFPSLRIIDAVLIMGVIAVIYTVVGGIKAVIYTDTFQWIILMSGLIFIGIPIGFVQLGGWEAIYEALPPAYFTLNNLSWAQGVNWFITIVPIWFIGMTLYQRIYACRDEQTAIKAWRIAGFFEWPVMAFMGIVLGMFAKVAFQQGLFTELGYAPGSEIDSELGLPLFLRNILPVGLMGLMMSAYFSAIMSTADSCLMAASGNLTGDILPLWRRQVKQVQASEQSEKNRKSIRLSQLVTLIIGILAVLLATKMQNVLELMLYSYAFMVSGLFVPVLALLIQKQPNRLAALTSMLTGGLSTLGLIIWDEPLFFGLDPIFFGILISTFSYFIVSKLNRPSSV